MPISRDYLVIHWMLNKLPVAQIAKNLGVKPHVIYYHLKKHGFKCRGVSEEMVNNREFYRKRAKNNGSKANYSKAAKARWAKIGPEERSRMMKERVGQMDVLTARRVKRRNVVTRFKGSRLKRAIRFYLRRSKKDLREHTRWKVMRLRHKKVGIIVIHPYFVPKAARSMGKKIANLLLNGYDCVIVRNKSSFTRAKVNEFLPRFYESLYYLDKPITVMEF